MILLTNLYQAMETVMVDALQGIRTPNCGLFYPFVGEIEECSIDNKSCSFVGNKKGFELRLTFQNKGNLSRILLNNSNEMVESTRLFCSPKVLLSSTLSTC